MESSDKPHKNWRNGNMYVIAHVIALITAYAARHCVQRSCIDMCLLFFLDRGSFFPDFYFASDPITDRSHRGTCVSIG